MTPTPLPLYVGRPAAPRRRAEQAWLLQSDLRVRNTHIARLAGFVPSTAITNANIKAKSAADINAAVCTQTSWAKTVGRAVTVCAIAASCMYAQNTADLAQFDMSCMHSDSHTYGTIPGTTRTDGLIELDTNPFNTAAAFGFTQAAPSYDVTADAAHVIGSGRDSWELLETISSGERASAGTVRLKPNHKAPAAVNKLISELNTRDRVLHAMRNALRQWNIRALEPASISNQLSAVRNWEPFMREVYLRSPYRLVWGSDMNAATRRQEEDYLLGFMVIMDMRCTTFSSVDNMLSHIRQFHLTVLDIAVPKFDTIFPRLTNARAKGRIRDKKQPKGRRRRPTFKVSQIITICTNLIGVIKNRHAHARVRHDACVMLCIICAGFTLLFRIGELAKGDGFDPRLHWTISWLSCLRGMVDKQVRCIMQPQRKRESEATKEAMPIVMRKHNINFAHAVQRLFNLRDALNVGPQHEHDDFFALADGSSPTTDWVAGRLKSLAKAAIPLRLAMLMDYTNHCLRRGGATANDVNDVPVVVQERAGAWAPGSASRPLYIARIMERQAKAQYQMADTPEITIIQDDVGFNDSHARNPGYLDECRADPDEEDEFLITESLYSSVLQDNTRHADTAEAENAVGLGMKFTMGSAAAEFSDGHARAEAPPAKRRRGRPVGEQTLANQAAQRQKEAQLRRMRAQFRGFFKGATSGTTTDETIPAGRGHVTSESEDEEEHEA